MKAKKMTFNMIAAKVEDEQPVAINVYDDVTVEVKKRLDMKQSLQFVQDIVSTCFDEDEAVYIPEIFEPAVRIATLMQYAGIEIPKDASRAFAVVSETDLFDRVYEVIDHKQFEELVTGAKRKMAFRRDLLTSTAAQKVTELLSKLDEMVRKMSEATENFDAKELSDTMKDISEKLNNQLEKAEATDEDENVIVMPRRKEDEK